MEMSADEIVREYRTAKNKGKQVTILSELNGCTREDIIAILSAGGINPKELPRSRKKANVVPGGGHQAHCIIEQEIRTLAEHRAIIFVALEEYLAKMQRELEDENKGHKEREEYYTKQIALIKKTIDILDFDIEKL